MNKNKKAKEIKKNTSPYLKASYMYTKPTHKNKQKSNHYILEKKKNGKVVAHVMGWRTYGWNQPIWVPKEIITFVKGSMKVYVPKATWSPRDSGGFGDLATQEEQFKPKPSTPRVGAN